MSVAGIGSIEIRVGNPVFKSHGLTCFSEVFGITLQNDVYICVGVGFPAFALVSPAKHAGTLLIAGAGYEVTELCVGVLWVLGEVPDAVKHKLVAGLDTTEVQACVVHRLVHIYTFAGSCSLLKRGKQTYGKVHAGVGVAKGGSAL